MKLLDGYQLSVDARLEQVIQRAVDRCNRAPSSGSWERLRRLIMARSDEQVRRMERQRGLL